MKARPALAGLVAVLVGSLVLGLVGLGVEDKLDPLSLTISGTTLGRRGRPGQGPLRRRHAVRRSCSTVPPPRSNARGRPWSGRCATRRTATVISPWDRGTVTALRPGPRKALVIVDYHVPLATAMRDTVPELEGVLERTGPPAPAGDPVGLRLGLPRPAGRNDRRDRAGRAARRPAPADRPADRLPLGRRRGDPARLRRPHRARRARRPRPAQLGDDGRRDLARRLHDDGAGPRRRLLAADRLALPRGARRGAKPARGGDAQPGDGRPHHRLRRLDPARRAGPLRLRAARLAAALAGRHGRRRDDPQRPRRRRRPARPPRPARRAGQRRPDRPRRPAGPRARGSRRSPRRRCGAPASPRS